MVEADTASEPGAASRPVADGVASQALYGALGTGALGGLIGLVIGLAGPPLPVSGTWLALGSIAAVLGGVIAAVVAGLGYWRVRDRAGADLAPWLVVVNTTAVVLAHAVLAAIICLAAFEVISLGFIGLLVPPFWTTVALAVVAGLTVYWVYPSVIAMTSQRLATLLMAFVGIGTMTAMVTTPDPHWWAIHFSHLGTFWTISGLMFNGTLVIGGVLVAVFGFHLATDIQPLVSRGVLSGRSTGFVRTLFLLLGTMLAGVGLVPVNISLLIHNILAAGLAVAYLALLVGGPWLLKGMPRAYFIASAAFLAALVVAIILFAVGYFGTTAFEIVVFAFVFGWISVFIRFLGEAGSAR